MKVSKQVKKIRIQNLRVKLLTLLSGFFIWFFVITANEYFLELNVLLRLQNIPENHVLAEPVPQKIRVLFRGSGRDLLHMLLREKKMILNLNHRADAQFYPLSTDLLQAMPGQMNLKPVSVISPDSVFISLDIYQEKKVPVRSGLNIATMDGYIQVGRINFNPDSVLIKGARQLVDRVDEILTETDSYQFLLKDLSRNVQLVKPEVDLLALSQSSVNFSVDIQRIGERNIDGIPIRVVNLPASISDAVVVPSTLSLVVHGGNNFLMDLKPDQISATIDYRLLGHNLHTGGVIRQVRAAIDLPEDIIYYHAVPQSFDIILER
jgi:hypothetical protein